MPDKPRGKASRVLQSVGGAVAITGPLTVVLSGNVEDGTAQTIAVVRQAAPSPQINIQHTLKLYEDSPTIPGLDLDTFSDILKDLDLPTVEFTPVKVTLSPAMIAAQKSKVKVQPISNSNFKIEHKHKHKSEDDDDDDSSDTSYADRIVNEAKRYVDTDIPYVRGGNSVKDGMDCSHFVWMVYKNAGLDVPYRTSSALISWAERTSTPQPGDLVLYKGHVGIYVSRGMMIDQGRSGGAFLRKIYTQNFIGYGTMP